RWASRASSPGQEPMPPARTAWVVTAGSAVLRQRLVTDALERLGDLAGVDLHEADGQPVPLLPGALARAVLRDGDVVPLAAEVLLAVLLALLQRGRVDLLVAGVRVAEVTHDEPVDRLGHVRLRARADLDGVT